MMRLFFLGSIALIIMAAGCKSGGNGELTGVQKRGKYFEPSPLGMALISGRSFNMGPGDQDVTYATSPTRTVDISSFWMDDTEITNNEYRQFVYWVRDSTIREMLARNGFADDFKPILNRKGDSILPPILNWDRRIDKRDAAVMTVVDSMFYSGSDRIFGRKDLDIRKLNFHLYYDYRC